MKALVFSNYYLPGYKGGGPIKTIKNLIEQTNRAISYRVITSDRDLGNNTPYSEIIRNKWNTVQDADVFYLQPGIRGFFQILILLLKKDYHIVYINSFFSLKFSLCPLLISKLLNRQVVLGPRGEFSGGALKLKTKKKKVFIEAYKLLRLSHGIVFQASSEYEAEDIRKALGAKTDIFIAEDIGSAEFATNIPNKEQTIKAVFLSRISPMKNLDLALSTLKKVKGPLVYHIYGPIEDRAYWQKCLDIIDTLPSHIKVDYKGELKPEQVVERISSYDFFFMPTKGENYSHVIAEALCAGLPLVISDTTPWRNLESLSIGWDLPLDNLDMFSKVIDKLIEMSDDNHYKMRQTALAWAKHKFSQRDAIENNIDMFHYAYNKKKGKNHAL